MDFARTNLAAPTPIDPWRPGTPNPAGLAAAPVATLAAQGAAAEAPERGAVAEIVGRAFEATPPIRMHIETNGTSVALWLGLDAAALPKLPAVLEQLSRQLARIGLRLRSVVCNGTPRPISHLVKEP